MANLRSRYEGASVLVTGGAGFIGSHLVEALLGLGARVTVLDDLSGGHLDNLAAVREAVELRVGSLLDSDALDELVPGRDWIFHLAANASVPRSSQEPGYDYRANVEGTFRVVDAMRRAGGHGTLVFASSAAVYGEPLRSRMAEEHPLRPQSPYGGGKLAGEFIIEGHARCFGLDTRTVRIFNTYGPRQRRYVMYDILEKLRRDPAHLEVIGTGDQERDYNHVSDTVAALLLVGAEPTARGEAYNVAGGHPITIRVLVECILAALGLSRPVVSFTMQSWPGDVVRMVADTRKIQALGWAPRTDLDTGLRDLIAWHHRGHSPAK